MPTGRAERLLLLPLEDGARAADLLLGNGRGGVNRVRFFKLGQRFGRLAVGAQFYPALDVKLRCLKTHAPHRELVGGVSRILTESLLVEIERLVVSFRCLRRPALSY